MPASDCFPFATGSNEWRDRWRGKTTAVVVSCKPRKVSPSRPDHGSRDCTRDTINPTHETRVLPEAFSTL
jgi:hypothetical protein